MNPDLMLLLNFRLYILIGVAIIFVCFIILAIKKVKLEWHFLTVALGIGFLYMLTITPMSGGDEWTHYAKATYLSSYLVSQENTTFSRASDFDYSRLGFHQNVPRAYLRFFEEGIHRVDSEFAESRAPTGHARYYPIQYIPQILGVTIGRLLQLNFFGLFYLGRLFNLMFFVTCGFFAIRSLEEFKLPVFIIGILPMTMHQAATLTYDSFINGVSLLFLAYLIRFIYERDDWSYRDIAVMAITGVLLAPAKTIYFTLLLLLVFAIPYKYGWKNKKGYIIATGICAVGVLNILFFNFANLQNTANPYQTWHELPNYSIAIILANPLDTILVFIRTIWVYYSFIFYSMFGQFLSGLTLTLPRWYILIFVLVLIASVFYGKKDSWIPSWLHRGVFFVACCGVVFLSMLGMLIAWTPSTHGVILGLQGRYYIPILPLVMLLFRSKWMLDKQLFAYGLIGVAVFMHFLILRYILDFTIGRL